MRNRFSLVPFAVVAMALAAAHAGAQAGNAGQGFAVVELFTSEGCSSCPPADVALMDIAQEAEKEGLPVYALEWHVDYWDYLGWKDPFDSHLATERQYAYSKALPSSVYTPQAVINGRIVPSYASNKLEINSDIRSLVKTPARALLHLQLLPADSTAALRFHADVSGAPAGARLLIMLTESGLGATPNAGENAGSRLAHSNVVREVKVLHASSVETTIDIPAGVELSRSRLVGVIQDPNTMSILGADQAFPGAHAAARLSGKVIDGAGRAVAGATTQACNGSICIRAVTDASGTFVFDSLWSGQYSLAFDAKQPVVLVSMTGRDVSLSQPLVVTR